MTSPTFQHTFPKPGTWSALQRSSQFERLASQSFELLVIGGGITGAGIALDAQTRGIRTALIDMQDFAAGTSSRSTKLVHGGLRYLKQLEIGVVAEVGKERAIVYENGPHITTPEWMLLPFYKGGTFGRFSTSLGLRVYDFLAGVKKAERRRMLSADAAAQREPLLNRTSLKGGGYYVEYRTDDARLTIEVMKKAVEAGALPLPYVKADSFAYDASGQINGVRVTDLLTGATAEVRAAKVINAAGPWVDTLREADGSKHGKTLHLTKGVHLVFDQARFPLRQAIYFDTPDKRMVFAITRDGKTYIGTTDTNYKADKAHPRMTTKDIAYILDAANSMFPTLKLTEQDVESSWAGLRPLIHQEGKDPSEISRRDEIFQSASGLLSMAGGKLTGYRKMAETVVDRAASQLQAAGVGVYGPSLTKHMPLSGGDVGGSAQFPSFIAAMREAGVKAGLSAPEAERIARRYGSNAPKLFLLAPDYNEEAAARGIPLALMIELVYAIHYEMAVKPADFWIRRTGALLFDRATVLKWKDAVLAYMSEQFGWSEQTKQAYAEELASELHYAVTPVEAE
ncbi:Glycerol-3-phosphate dehydrogenase [Paenibacillus curdlanolyticus YK9]|uniref:Glycerol-3-phosphate dehydrogenase n=1 Tax=Paenibacillus curdlanolyticus YK9 TaxID=717606 RepID=E0I9X1_9BACL|nr:FAD-dependent oxidoreductase [Paenibacillus curdlanolyticus]EFM10548.1 Glycerol-3-phosphate dehydrogenase [Paenibacillus curdlanolyticus YK9]